MVLGSDELFSWSNKARVKMLTAPLRSPPGSIQEGDARAVGREARRAEGAAGTMLVDDRPDGVFEAHATRAAAAPHHRHALAVRRPVGRVDLLRDLPVRAPGEGRARERPGVQDAVPPVHRGRVQSQRQLARGGHAQEVRVGHVPERTRLGALGTHAEDADGIVAPAGPIQDRLAVRREAGRGHVAAPVRQALVHGRPALPAAPGEARRARSPDPGPAAGPARRARGEGAARAPAPRRGARSPRAPFRGRLELERLQGDGEVVGGMEAVFRLLLQAAAHHPLEHGRHAGPLGNSGGSSSRMS